MKKLITIAFFVITAKAFSQSRLDTLVFNKVNEYRAENCLAPLKWSSNAQQVAKNQAEYCSRVKYVLHDQTDSVGADFQIEPDFEKRFSKHGINVIGKDWIIAENLVVDVDTSVNYIKTDEIIASETLISWKNSPEHNAMMLIPGIEFASVSHAIGDEYTTTEFDFNSMSNYLVRVRGKAYYVALDAYK